MWPGDRRKVHPYGFHMKTIFSHGKDPFCVQKSAWFASISRWLAQILQKCMNKSHHEVRVPWMQVASLSSARREAICLKFSSFASSKLARSLTFIGM